VAPTTWTNWAGTQTAHPVEVARPGSTAEVVALVSSAASRGMRAKVVGSGHSFTGAAVTDGLAIDLSRLCRLESVDPASGLVTAGAGITLAALSQRLAGFGLALANLGDIAVQSVAGAISTGTHGTGARLGGLATQVVGLEIVLADGSVHRCSADVEPELFQAARLGLGALGVVTSTTLQAVPAFNLRAVEAVERVDDVLADLDATADGVDHFEFYWVPHTDLARTKRNSRTGEGPRGNGRFRYLLERELLENLAFGALCRLERRAPALTPRLAPMVATGAARDFVDRSYRVFASPRRVHFVEMEYAIPRPALAEALGRLRSIVGRGDLRIAFPVEVRVAAADDVWLSTAHGRRSAYVAVHQYVGMEYRRWFDAVEEVMVDLGGRPHWGKLHTRDHAYLAASYPCWDRWQAVRARVDPSGMWANPYLDRVLGPVGAAAGPDGHTSGQG
jgi:FAD-linked oxidoreductase